MLLLDLFRRLSFGELSNLAVSEEGSGNIKPESRAKLVSYTNEGLLRLYTRFVLSEKTVLIETVEGVTHYHFKRKFAESSGSNVPYHYIKDLMMEPFQEDMVRVLAVFDSYGRQRILNDVGDPTSVFTPQPDILQVRTPRNGEALSVIYQARHYELEDSGSDMLGQYIDLPSYLEPILQVYVASKFYSHMNGQEHVAKGVEYGQTFEALCLEAEMKDLVNNTWSTSHNKLEQRGFV